MPHVRIKGVLQLLINRCGYIRFAQVPERVSTQSFVVLSTENSKSNNLGAQGTFKPAACLTAASLNMLVTSGALFLSGLCFSKRLAVGGCLSPVCCEGLPSVWVDP